MQDFYIIIGVLGFGFWGFRAEGFRVLGASGVSWALEV